MPTAVWTAGRAHFHFTGEGAPGADHKDAQGNAALAGAFAAGRTLRLLRPAGVPSSAGLVRYLSAFRLDEDIPWVRTDVLDPVRPGHPSGSALVFRLLPLEKVPEGFPAAEGLPEQTQVTETDLFTVFRPVAWHAPGREPTAIESAAQRLLYGYRDLLRADGRDVRRYRITPAGTLDLRQVDLTDHSRGEIVTASGSTARPYIRATIGELRDLHRYFTPRPGTVLLLPTALRGDLADLCAAGVGPVSLWMRSSRQVMARTLRESRRAAGRWDAARGVEG